MHVTMNVEVNSLDDLVSSYSAASGKAKKAIAAEFGCTYTTFLRKLSGRSDLTVREARKLAHVLGTDVDSVVHVAP